MHDDYEEQEPWRGGELPYPSVVRSAGVIWVVFGGLILLNALVNLGLTVGAQRANQGQAGAGVVPFVVGILFGAVFIHVGVQSIRGTAKDTLGNGIGSIIFGVLNGGWGLLLLLGGAVIGGQVGAFVLIVGGIGILAG